MELFKRISAALCIAVIFLSYAATVVAVFLKQENWIEYFKSAIFVTVVFPIMLYGLLLVAKYLNNRDKSE